MIAYQRITINYNNYTRFFDMYIYIDIRYMGMICYMIIKTCLFSSNVCYKIIFKIVHIIISLSNFSSHLVRNIVIQLLLSRTSHITYYILSLSHPSMTFRTWDKCKWGIKFYTQKILMSEGQSHTLALIIDESFHMHKFIDARMRRLTKSKCIKGLFYIGMAKFPMGPQSHGDPPQT